jgi:hypothetical protein
MIHGVPQPGKPDQLIVGEGEPPYTPILPDIRRSARAGSCVPRKLFYHGAAEVQVPFSHIPELFFATVRPGDVIAIHPGDIFGVAMPESFPQDRTQSWLFWESDCPEKARAGRRERGDKGIEGGSKETVTDEDKFQGREGLGKHTGYAFPEKSGLLPGVNRHEYRIAADCRGQVMCH